MGDEVQAMSGEKGWGSSVGMGGPAYNGGERMFPWPNVLAPLYSNDMLGARGVERYILSDRKRD